MDEQVLICPVCGHSNPTEARFCQNDGVALQEGDSDDPLVGRLVGNYRLKERIGEGGFGVVYRAEHRELHTTYAVKILHPQFSANAHVAERFRREAAAAGRLRHENVVHIADFGQAQGVGYFYVMEFLEGKTLKEALDREEPFPPERILHIARQVTSAMERVHELQIIHRDLKPENIFLITKNNRQDHVKLVDFGIAKVMDGGASITRTGLSVGTPLYMSPEQARGLLRDLDIRSDIYSWGIILFELLTYQPPFFSENPHDVVMLQIRATPPRLSDTHPYRNFSEPIERFFRRVLSKNREDRPPTMSELYEEFEPLLLATHAFHDVEPTMDFHSAQEAEVQEEHTLMPYAEPTPSGGPRAGTDPGLYAPLGHEDLLGYDDAVIHAEGTSIDSLPALHEEEAIEVTQIQRNQLGDTDNYEPVPKEPVEVTAIAPSPRFESAHDKKSAHHDARAAYSQGPEGDLLTAESEHESTRPSPFIGAPPSHGPAASESLDDIFEGLPIPDASGEVVASLRMGVSVGDTSEAMWGGASMATDPNALHSPLQRYWWAFAIGFVVFLGLIFWMARTPKQSRVRASRVASRVDAGAMALRGTPPTPDQAPQVRRGVEPPQPLRQVTPTPPVLPDIRPLAIAPLRTSVRPRALRVPRARPRPQAQQVFRLLLRSNPRASCYLGAPGSERRFVGKTPCEIRGRYSNTVYIRLTRKGYRPIIRLWTVGGNEVWMLNLVRRRRRRARRRTPPAQRRDTPPPPRRRGDGDVFNQTPNPFTKKIKPSP